MQKTKINRLTKLFIVSFLNLLFGCTSHFKIVTEPPGVEVALRIRGAEKFEPLGQTPLEITTKQIEDKVRMSVNSGELVELQFNKKGYRTEYLVLPPSRMVTVQTDLKVKMIEGAREGEIADTLLTLVDNSQKFAQNRDFDRALIEIDKAISMNANFIKAYNLKGTFYYLKNDLANSLLNFEKALSLDPKNQEALKMINFLKKK